MPLLPVLLAKHDSCGAFGGGGSVTRAVGAGLYDVHHAVLGRIAADIERVCSHQNAGYRIYTRVKLYFRHT